MNNTHIDSYKIAWNWLYLNDENLAFMTDNEKD